MEAEIVQELRARLEENDRVRKDLGGFMYLSPNRMPEWPNEDVRAMHHDINTPHKLHVNVHLTVRYFRENGIAENACLRVS